MRSRVDISIIVPIYNASKYIGKCIDSLIGQSKKELEFILINDGSTDNTEEVIKGYNDKRIKYFKNKNQGIGKTRNFGIDKAIGKYIMFVDSDDYIDKDMCKKMFEKAEADRLDLVVCDFYNVFDNGGCGEVRLLNFDKTTLKGMPCLLNKINLAPWNKLYRRDLIINNHIRFVEGLKYEDAPFVVSALDKANGVGKINECLNFYIIHSNSETTIRDKRIFDIIKIVDIIRNYFKGKDYMKDEVDILTISILVNYNIQQRMQIDKKIAMKFIDESFAYLEKNVPDYKNNKYFKKRIFLKRLIEKNKIITKLYCKIYSGWKL